MTEGHMVGPDEYHHKIGVEPCIGNTRRATYIGPVPELIGKTALIMDSRSAGHVGAQFDDVTTGRAFGWHQFSKEEFDETT